MIRKSSCFGEAGLTRLAIKTVDLNERPKLEGR